MFITCFHHCFVSENKPKKLYTTWVEVTDVSNDNIAHQTVGTMPSDINKLCKFWLKNTMYESFKMCLLLSDSTIDYNDHPILCPSKACSRVRFYTGPIGIYSTITQS